MGAGAKPAWTTVPRTSGRLTSSQLGLVINESDAYSVAVGTYYANARQLRSDQILRLQLPSRPVLSEEEFEILASQVSNFFGPNIQALALAWVEPYAVGCNSITGALALGYDAALCKQSCAPSRPSSYFNSPSASPLKDHRLRPSMLLAASDVEGAKAMIRRGVASDRTLGLRGALPAHAHYLVTSDKARSSRAALFPPPGFVRSLGIDVHVQSAQSLGSADRVLLYLTGLPRVEGLGQVKWVPGALADHLTSYGGQLDGKSGQMSALAWIDSGATASYGTVSEPCSHPQKFPHPQLLLLHYAQGSTALEAYWKSVAWPQQGLFIGEPLAAPFAKQ